MTTTETETATFTAPVGDRSEDIELSAPRREPKRQPRLMFMAIGLPPIGAVLLLLSFHRAAGRATPDQLQFALFWAGFLVGMLPLVALACARRTGAAARTWALVGIGLFGMIPRLLQPGPAGPDEYCHLRQTLEAFLAGDVGHTSFLLPITQQFPGLHQAASAFARVTGVPLWPAGMIVIVLAHVLSVLAIYQLVRMVGVPARGAAVGAVAYTLNPSWLYFDAVVSYESLALPIALWFLAATVAAGRESKKLNVRAVAMAMFCAAVLPVIHHLTTIMLCLIVLLLIVARAASFVRHTAAGGRGAGRERFWTLIFIGGFLLASIVWWWWGMYEWIVAYLGPSWASGYAQLQKILNGETQSSGSRSLFEGAANPSYEIVCGYALPFVLLALFAWSVIVLWRNRSMVSATAWAFAVLGGMFFLSLPMVLTAGGAEGAHRSWAFSFIGLAVVAGLAWSIATARPTEGVPTRWPRLAAVFSKQGVKAALVGIVFTVVAFGSVAVGTNVPHRFPGAAQVGDDARSVSRESAAVAMWLAAHAPVDTRVLADRFVSLQVGSIGRMASLRPSPTFPIWNMYMSASPIPLEVLKMIFDSKINYLVVDSRMATARPLVGYWFTRDEPGAGGNDLFPQAALDRFNCLPWLRSVFAAGPLTVYEVNDGVLRRTRAASCEAGAR